MFSHSVLVYPQLVDPATWKLQVPLQVLPELPVSEAVDDGAKEARKHVDNQEVGKPDLQDPTGEDELEDHLHAGGQVGQHAHEELRSVEQDGPTGSLGRRLLGGEPARRKQDPQVGEDQCQEDAGEVDEVKGQTLLSQDGIFEDTAPQAEDRLVEEAEGLGG